MGGRVIAAVVAAVCLGLLGGFLVGSATLRADLDEARLAARESQEDVDDLEEEIEDLEDENEELSDELAASADEVRKAERKAKRMERGTFGLSAEVKTVSCKAWCNGANVTVLFRNESAYAGPVSCAFKVEVDDDSGTTYHFSGGSDYVPAQGETTGTVTWYGEPGLRIPAGIYVHDSEACERYGDI